MRKTMLILLATVLICPVCFAQEDLFSKDYTGKYVEILMKNGQDFRCKIANQTGDSFQFEMYGCEVSFDKASVAKITDLDDAATKGVQSRDQQAITEGKNLSVLGSNLEHKPRTDEAIQETRLEERQEVATVTPVKAENKTQAKSQASQRTTQRTQTRATSQSRPSTVSYQPRVPVITKEQLGQKSTSQKIVDEATKNVPGGYSTTK